MERSTLWKLLGDLPQRDPLKAQKVTEAVHPDGYFLETWMLDLNDEESVPAYIAKPLGKEGPFPLVLVNHSHGGRYEIGKQEFIEPSPYLQPKSYAKTLTELGYMAACIDMWGFGERAGRTESEIVKAMLWKGQVMWGMMLHDNLRFLDYLCERTDTDASRVATVGMSMGGLMAWWLAALDERIQVTVDIAGQVDAGTLLRYGRLDSHGYYSYVPGLLKHASTLEIQQLIAPRARMSVVGRHDRLCPFEGVVLLDEGLKQTYAEMGKPEHWQTVLSSCGHQESAHMRGEWIRFLQTHLPV